MFAAYFRLYSTTPRRGKTPGMLFSTCFSRPLNSNRWRSKGWSERSKISKISIFIWVFAAATTLMPIYLGPSGGIQISHGLFATAAIAILATYGFELKKPELLLFSWLTWVTVRESAAVIDGLPYQSLLAAAYAIFNLLLVISVRKIVAKGGENFAKYGLCGSIAVATLGVIFLGSGAPDATSSARAIGTFNNPNQLGYFAICCLSCACLLYFSGIIGRSYLIYTLFACTFLAAASLSKAALVSVCVPAALACIVMTRKRKYYLLGIGLCLALVTISITLLKSGMLDDIPAIQRIKLIGSDSDDSLAARGYTIINFMGPLQIFFGLGTEGVKSILGHEVHSTTFNNFAAYGLLGASPFFIFLMIWAHRVYSTWGLTAWLCIWLPPMLYGLTHNGSRFTAFWIVAGLSIALSQNQRNNSRATSKKSNKLGGRLKLRLHGTARG